MHCERNDKMILRTVVALLGMACVTTNASQLPCNDGIQQYTYYNATTLANIAIHRLRIQSREVDVDPSTVPLTFRFAASLAPPLCQLASVGSSSSSSFDMKVLHDLKGQVGWVDITKDYTQAFNDQSLSLEKRRQGWVVSNGLPLQNASYWLMNEPRSVDNVHTAAVYVPSDTGGGLKSVPADSHQPGAYYVCCFALNREQLKGGGRLDVVRGVIAEQQDVLTAPLDTTSPGAATAFPTARKPSFLPTTTPQTATPSTLSPFHSSTNEPTEKPTNEPTDVPTDKSTDTPSTSSPVHASTNEPTTTPTSKPTQLPTDKPTNKPTDKPTDKPSTATPTTDRPTRSPIAEGEPTDPPTTSKPTDKPTGNLTNNPTGNPTYNPTGNPTNKPTDTPTAKPTDTPTDKPTDKPSTAGPGETGSPTNSLQPTSFDGCFRDTAELRAAIGDFDNPEVIERYGPLRTWCVSRLTQMSNIFATVKGQRFNEDISGWVREIDSFSGASKS